MYGSFRMPIEPGEEYAVFQIVIDLSHLFVICGMVKFQWSFLTGTPETNGVGKFASFDR